MPRRRYFVVDAFAWRPFSGNPAAVVPLDSWPSDEWLQNVAAEMNLSETAYFVPEASGYRLRWFTPAIEVDLCGHATLAAAKVISHLGLAGEGEQVKFSSRGGNLTALIGRDSIELDFPLTAAEPVSAPAGLLEALGAAAAFVGKNQFDFLVELESDSAVRALAPDISRLSAIPCRGIIVTACSNDPQFDFVSRFFAPAAGINEDPVTGSAHCSLADFWSSRLGKTKFRAYQASKRGGILQVELRGERVLLGGRAMIFSQGELFEA